MSFEPEFTTYDGLEIRLVSSPTPGAPSVLLLSPWPESVYAYAPMWPYLENDLSLVAVDLPGFGQSQGRRDLMGPRAMAEFIVALAAELGLAQPHAVGPDIGTGALLFAAAKHPGVFRSLTVGAGAATFPLHVAGALQAFIDAESVDAFRDTDPADVVRNVVASIANYEAPSVVVDDYIQSYSGARFVDSIEYVRSYPTDLADLSPLLGSIATPVQIIVGRDDPYDLAVDGQRLHEQLPNSRLDIFPTGHHAWEEDPARYGAAVADWVELASGGADRVV